MQGLGTGDWGPGTEDTAPLQMVSTSRANCQPPPIKQFKLSSVQSNACWSSTDYLTASSSSAKRYTRLLRRPEPRRERHPPQPLVLPSSDAWTLMLPSPQVPTGRCLSAYVVPGLPVALSVSQRAEPDDQRLRRRRKTRRSCVRSTTRQANRIG